MENFIFRFRDQLFLKAFQAVIIDTFKLAEINVFLDQELSFATFVALQLLF